MLADRADAGRQLAKCLQYLHSTDPVVLGLPRGGVVVAAEVARALHAPLDVIMVRKLPTPLRPELALGAVAEQGVSILNDQVRRAARVRADDVRTIEAACQVARVRRAARVVLAVPVASREALAWLRGIADDVVCLNTDNYLIAIGTWYRHFTQVTDEQVHTLLDQAPDPWTDIEVTIPAAPVELPGRLTVPDAATGIVVFAHSSGSSRHSPRNQYVAMLLNRAGLGTLLFDLLTPPKPPTAPTCSTSTCSP